MWINCRRLSIHVEANLTQHLLMDRATQRCVRTQMLFGAWLPERLYSCFSRARCDAMVSVSALMQWLQAKLNCDTCCGSQPRSSYGPLPTTFSTISLSSYITHSTPLRITISYLTRFWLKQHEALINLLGSSPHLNSPR